MLFFSTIQGYLHYKYKLLTMYVSPSMYSTSSVCTCVRIMSRAIVQVSVKHDKPRCGWQRLGSLWFAARLVRVESRRS